MSKGAAFVVGGTGGLGQAICRRMAADWGVLGIGYRNSAEKAQALATELSCNAVPISCDLADTQSVRSALEGFADLSTIVFAGGVAISQPYVSNIVEAEWREVIETELFGFIRVVEAALPLFRAQGHGNFVSVVSVATHAYPPGDALSAVPKAGIEMLGRAIAKEEGRNGIRANMVAPGIIDAGLGAAFLKDLYSPEIWETQRKRIALRRFGTAEEVAEAVAFLASDASRYMTGQTLIVDGGFSL